MNMTFKIVAHEGERIGQVTGEVKDYPRTPMQSLVDMIQVAMLEAGFSFEAEVLDLSFEEEGDAEE